MSSSAILQVRSHYSVYEGLNRIDDICSFAVNNGIHSIALTDLDNMCAWVKFYLKARSNGIKPIAGVTVLISVNDYTVQCVLLCLNNDGYLALIELLSKAYKNANRYQQKRPIVQLEWLSNKTGIAYILDPLGYDLQRLLLQDQGVEDLFVCIRENFSDNLYAALPIIAREDELSINEKLAKICYQYKIPLLASYPICFQTKDDFYAHEVRVCIDQGRVIHDESRKVSHTNQQYMRASDEYHRLYSAVPQAIENANNLSKRCNVTLDMDQVLLPNISQGKSADDDFNAKVKLGLEDRLKQLDVDESQQKLYWERLDIEINTICQMGFASYFLIVADFIQWAKNNHVPVGPGRGSGAGSLAAYALLITDIDPLQYDLLFERFLNPERVSMPDFDIDFCMVGRDRVIQYVADKYGRDQVSQIITFGTMAAKAVIRDVGRVLGHPYGFVDKIAKLIPMDLGTTIDSALAQEPILAQRYQQESEVRTMIDLCKVLEGLTRNIGTHAGGVVIAPSAISDVAPIYMDATQSSLVTQYDKDDIEKIGLVKFDFLGLRTLTIIDWAIKNIKSANGSVIDITSIRLDDEKTFSLLQKSLTTGVFQLESHGMKELIDRLAPDCFEDIVALVALYRPGPLQSGMVDDFVKRKHGLEPVTYLHERLEPILKNTYGVILYQEQVMQIAQDLAGYSLGGADLLRRAMGKKKPEEMEKQRNIFLTGAKEQKIDSKIALEIFSLMEKFAGYGFNKSHSAAYALISYQTAWLKANYPTALMASVLSSDMDNTDKLILFLEDTKSIGIKVLPPCINHSSDYFLVSCDMEIRYGLCAIKGVGGGVAREISKQAPFSDLAELCGSVEKINRRVLESLIKSGACDVWGEDRATVLASVDKALSSSVQQRLNAQQGQADLFGDSDEQMFAYNKVHSVSRMQTLKDELDSLGYYLSGHPVDVCKSELVHLRVKPISNLKVTNSPVRSAGVLGKLKVVKTKKGGRIAFGSFSDDGGEVDVAFFDESYQQNYETLSTPGILIFEGVVSHDQFTNGLRLQCSKVSTLDDLRAQMMPTLVVTVKSLMTADVSSFMGLIESKKGGSNVRMHYVSSSGIASLDMPFKVGVNEDLLSSLYTFPGVESVEVIYT